MAHIERMPLPSPRPSARKNAHSTIVPMVAHDRTMIPELLPSGGPGAQRKSETDVTNSTTEYLLIYLTIPNFALILSA